MASQRKSEFFSRFKGKISKIDKHGLIDIILKPSEPIMKKGRPNTFRRSPDLDKSWDRKNFSHQGALNSSQKFHRSVFQAAGSVLATKTPNLHKKTNSKIDFLPSGESKIFSLMIRNNLIIYSKLKICACKT
jgi:hypothetical protein